MKGEYLKFMSELADSLFQPVLSTFSREDLEYAVKEEIYLPEFVAVMAPEYLMQLKSITETVPKHMLKQFELKHLLEWLKDNEPEKYKWFYPNGRANKKRLRWLKWNLIGFRKFMLEASNGKKSRK